VVAHGLLGEGSVSNFAEFKSKRSSNFFIGLGLLLIPAGVAYLVFFSSEDEFLHTRVRRGGGLMKLIEQSIGWETFCFLMLAFAVWAIAYSAVSFWKVFDGTADVTAYDDHVEFHPAVKSVAATYDDISHWNVQMVSGHPVLWIHFFDTYWSLQGLYPRGTVKLEGSAEELEPLITYFSDHVQMREKFAR